MYDLHDRGYVREGMTADLAVFDPDTVAPGPLRRMRTSPPTASGSWPTRLKACPTSS